MCGIAGIFGENVERAPLEAMAQAQPHRGPDARGVYLDDSGAAGLAHNRLSILDLSEAGCQPMASTRGRLHLAFNGEIYNYRELREELADYPYRSRTDSEVILAAYQRWGESCLDRLLGMFAFLLWDEERQCLFAARDRFGVKPLFYHARADGSLLLASEIKALHAAGVAAQPDEIAWASYLACGVQDGGERTFWKNIKSLPAGCCLSWRNGQMQVRRWYDLAARVGPDLDERPLPEVECEYSQLLEDSVRLRFRADVPVGINLSGGFDSSLLLGLVQRVQGEASDVKAFTFTCDDERYDETPWVRQMLASTRHPCIESRLSAEEVPALAASVQRHQDEPFGGLPTLAYAKLFERARREGVLVLLDGQGLDEQWAGYDYYQKALQGGEAGIVQGTKESPFRADCLLPEFRRLAQPLKNARPFPDALRNLQLRDALYSKMPRALRFNDRASMRASVELREPFLDHRLFELALRQPPQRKIQDGVQKWLPRRIAQSIVPKNVREAPKRPLQTPQREWLRGPLRDWAMAQIEAALQRHDNWFDAAAVRAEWTNFAGGHGDNSFFVWQWINLGLMEVGTAASTRSSRT